jgi:hypothetical protein
MTEKDLSLISVDDLIKELDARFEHWIFTGCQIRTRNKDGDGDIFTIRKWKGNNATCLGLAQQMQFYLCDFHFKQDDAQAED